MKPHITYRCSVTRQNMTQVQWSDGELSIISEHNKSEGIIS